MNTRLFRMLLAAALLAVFHSPAGAQNQEIETPSVRITTYGASGWMAYGGDEMALLTTKKSVMLGVWHPSTRRFERNSGPVYEFRANGEIWRVGDNPMQIGEIESDGTLQSAKTPNVKLVGNDVMIDGVKYGSVSDAGAIHVLDDLVANCLGKVDKQVATFVVFCSMFTKEYLDWYKAAKVQLDAAEAARRQQVAAAAAQHQQQQAAQQQASGNNGSSRRRASYIEVSGSEVRALDGSRRAIGRASVVGGDIYVYSGTGGSVSTGKIRKSGSDYYVDFRGTTNVYRISKVGDDLVFYGSNGMSVGKVRHNGAMRRYEVQRDGSTATVAEFPDSLDPAYAALLFYNFFD